MKATAFVQPDTDTLVIDVSGANPDFPQTAQLKLWEPRTPQALTRGKMGLLVESWIDDKNPESSGRPFASLSAITVDGRDVVAAVSDPLTITISFKPDRDGHFRVLVASPHFDGTGNPTALAQAALSVPPQATHRSWWHAFWNRAAVIKISSKDRVGEYMENLRNIYLFCAAAEKGDEYPGSQAGSSRHALVRARRPPVGFFRLLALESAYASCTQPRRGRARVECSLLQSLSRKPAEHRGLDEEEHGGTSWSLCA